jgi:hypothetical protein
MREDKKLFKTITLRLSEEELKKLKQYAAMDGVSINNFLKKAIAIGFNSKAKNITNNSRYLSSPLKPQQHTIVDKVIMHACLEALYIIRTKESEEVLTKARVFAKDKTNEYAGN